MRDAAFAAAISAGVNLNNYNRYGLIFTGPSTCAGCADVGSCSTVTSSGTFNGGFVALNTNNMNPPFSWISERQVGVSLGCHELGHSIGMLHSGALTPATLTDVVGPLSSPGALNDGGDNNACNSQGTTLYLGHAAANEEAAVNWLPQSSSGYQLVQYPGTYTRLSARSEAERSEVGTAIVGSATSPTSNRWRRLFGASCPAHHPATTASSGRRIFQTAAAAGEKAVDGYPYRQVDRSQAERWPRARLSLHGKSAK
jgi:hypothetical protein